MKQTLQLGAFSAANVLSAVAFQWLLLTLLGPGQKTDALFAGMTVPTLFASVIGSSLTQVLVPLFSGETAEQQYRDSWSLLNLCGLLFLALAIVLGVTAPYWTPLTVLGFTPEGKQLTVVLSQISIIGMLFTGINSVQIALAFARNRYIWADAAAVIANIAALLSLFLLLPVYGVYAAVWVSVARLMIQTILLMRGMGRWHAPDRHAPIISEAWKRIRPMLIGSSYYKMDPLLDRFLLSSLTPGSLSIFYLAQQLYGAASQVVVKAFAVPANTRMSEAAKVGDHAGFERDLRATSIKMICLCLLAIVVLIIAGKAILSALLAHGQFSSANVSLLWIIMILSAGQFVWGAVGSLVTGAYYAKGDTVTPTIIGMISFTFAIAIKVSFLAYFGINGLAIAVTLFFTITIALLYTFLYRKRLDKFDPNININGNIPL
jgi:putative peptidoglycan lipid II flippase